jgi:hypothetical protein
MSSAIAHRVALVPHPSTPSDAIQSLDVQVSATAAGALTLAYSLRADLERLRIPRSNLIGRADELWRHTCFEAFINSGRSQSYYELNFSPAKQWAFYRFDTYREGMSAVALAEAPLVSVNLSPGHLELQALVHLPADFTGGTPRRPKLALAAVIEEDSGRLCYWAVRHSAAKPDFHHPDGFILELTL